MSREMTPRTRTAVPGTGGGTPRPTTSSRATAPYSGYGLGPPMMPSAEETAQAIQWQESIVYYGGGGSLEPRQNVNVARPFNWLIGLAALIVFLK